MGGVNSPEVLILKARLVELAAEYKTIKAIKILAAPFLDNAKTLIESANKKLYGTYNIQTIKWLYSKVNVNKNLQTLEAKPEDVAFLNSVIAECDRWLANLPNPITKELIANYNALSIIKARLNILLITIENSQKISTGTKEVLAIAFEMSNKELTADEQIVVNKYKQNLLGLAEAQSKGKFPQHQRIYRQTKKQMQTISGDEDAIGVLAIIDGKFSIAISEWCDYPDATLAHETQHLIQYRKGQIAYMEGQPLKWLYDIYDEMEAHKIQFLADPNSLGMPNSGVRITQIDEITEKYIIEKYPHLPRTPLSLDSTFEEIEVALTKVNRQQDGPKAFFATRVIHKTTKAPIWDWDKDLAKHKLKDFLLANNALVETFEISFMK